MVSYLDEVKTMSSKIKNFRIRQIPKEDNKKADTLANLALTFDFISDRSIPLKFIANPSIEVTRTVFQTATSPTWMNGILVYL